jgi:hypothetical protein
MKTDVSVAKEPLVYNKLNKRKLVLSINEMFAGQNMEAIFT